jgi:hypothetical protein
VLLEKRIHDKCILGKKRTHPGPVGKMIFTSRPRKTQRDEKPLGIASFAAVREDF